MDRRDFLTSSAVMLASASALPSIAGAQVTFAPQPGTWREYGLVTRVMIANAKGKTQAWIPVPSVDTEWFKSGESTWITNAQSAVEVRDPKYGTRMVHVEWAEGETAPAIDVISRVATQD